MELRDRHLDLFALRCAPAGASYPPIAFSVNVAANASSQVTTTASVSGGGLPAANAGDTTTVLASFADVSSTDVFLPAIDLLREYGITSGCSSLPPDYCPLDNITRGQMAVFVVRAVFGNDNFTYTTSPYFTDVPASNAYFKWIQAMRDLGITTGCGTNIYCPNDSVTRGQMAVFIIRARYGSTTAFSYPSTQSFTDVPSTNTYFQWIQKMKQLGVTSGCGANTYCPNDPVTREQMAAFIMRGAFNLLLPAGTPVITSISPAGVTHGQTATVTITGSNTNFAGGTQVNAGAGITVSNIVVTSGTTLTAQFSVASGATPGPRSITATTGAEEATLPNGLVVQ